jgi:hypothetical protein
LALETGDGARSAREPSLSIAARRGVWISAELGCIELVPKVVPREVSNEIQNGFGTNGGLWEWGYSRFRNRRYMVVVSGHMMMM